MLESLENSASSLGKIGLFGAFLLSGSLHVAVFLTLGAVHVPSQTNQQLLRIEAQLPTRQLVVAAVPESVDKAVLPSLGDGPSEYVLGEAGNVGRDSVSGTKILRMPFELDRELVPMSVPDLEPEYGFADDVGGRIVLNVLIAKDGSVLWLYVESSEASPSATEYVARMFRLSRFEAPTFQGAPVMTFTKVEVVIPRMTQ